MPTLLAGSKVEGRPQVYLKMQSLKHATLPISSKAKLSSKFYGPFTVLNRIGKVAAYRLNLPPDAELHPVFHVSQLKRRPLLAPEAYLPKPGQDGVCAAQPLAVLDTRTIQRRNTSVLQWLIHWSHLSSEDATWEDAYYIHKKFPAFLAQPFLLTLLT